MSNVVYLKDLGRQIRGMGVSTIHSIAITEVARENGMINPFIDAEGNDSFRTTMLFGEDIPAVIDVFELYDHKTLHPDARLGAAMLFGAFIELEDSRDSLEEDPLLKWLGRDGFL